MEGCAAGEASEEMVAVGRGALRVGKTRWWWVLGMEWVEGLRRCCVRRDGDVASVVALGGGCGSRSEEEEGWRLTT